MRRTKIQIYPEFNKGFAFRLLIAAIGIFGLLYLISWYTQVRPHPEKPSTQAASSGSANTEH